MDIPEFSVEFHIDTDAIRALIAEALFLQRAYEGRHVGFDGLPVFPDDFVDFVFVDHKFDAASGTVHNFFRAEPTGAFNDYVAALREQQGNSGVVEIE